MVAKTVAESELRTEDWKSIWRFRGRRIGRKNSGCPTWVSLGVVAVGLWVACLIVQTVTK